MWMGNDARVASKLVDDVAEQATLTPTYLVFMSLAGLLAGVGLLSNSVPILIGSMIIAPALPPLALVAFAVVAGRPSLAWRGAGVGLLGIAVAAVAGVFIAWLMNAVDVIPKDANLLQRPLLEERVRPGWWSLAAAFAAGIVGIEALSQKKTDTLVGTVAALALVPAAAAAGIAALSGDADRTLGGLLLLGVNVGLIIAMGILTLVVREGRPTGRNVGPCFMAVAIVALVVLLLAWARGSDKVTGNPPEIRTSAPATPQQQPARGDAMG
jgi:uncharacterized hydrophobic protein (TIGR00271 family)